MKKITLGLIILLLTTGCINNKKTNTIQSNPHNNKKIVGMWIQTEENINGDIKITKDSKENYLNITENKLEFYNLISTGNYNKTEHYFLIEGAKIYYGNKDFDELDFDSSKIDKDVKIYDAMLTKTTELILQEVKTTGETIKKTYEKINSTEWPIKDN